MIKEITDLQDVLNDLLPRDAERIILEAGCGSATYINFGSKARLVGIDISKKQLERNPALAEKIQGDLETYQFPSESFDVAICWEVLEHLSRPRQALNNMVRCLRPGGYLILAVPNVCSIKGLMAKFTPLAFHVWVYKHVWHFQHAGEDDHGPFRTYLRFAISPAALRKFARQRGLDIQYWRLYESPEQLRVRKKSRIVDAMLGLAGAMGRIFTFGRMDLNQTECIFVMQKKTSST